MRRELCVAVTLQTFHLASLLAFLPAQTIVVDAQNGPGAHYTTLTAAVAAAPDGATLEVRPGDYAGFAVAQKGLLILGESGVLVTSPIAIAATTATQPFTLRQLAFGSAVPALPWLGLANCAGPVLIDTVSRYQYPCGVQCPATIEATDCDLITIRNCYLFGDASLQDCNATLEGSYIWGQGGIWSQTTMAALRITRGSMQFVGSYVVGGNGTATVANAPGIVGLTGSLRLIDSSTFSGLNPNAALSPGVVGSAPGNVRRDPTSFVGQTAAPPPNVPVVTAIMPRLVADSTTLGGTLNALVATEPGDFVVILLGLPAAPTAVPGFTDAFFLDQSAFQPQAMGVQAASLPVRATAQIPNLAWLRGLQVVWHAACFGPVTGTQNTAPSIGLIR